MKRNICFFMIIMILFLTACTSGDNNPAAGEMETENTSPPALNTVVSTELITATPLSEEESTMVPNEQKAENTDEAAQPTSTGLNSGESEPVGDVDLSQITSEPPENPTPKVMPQPGVPNLEEQLSHEVSQDLAKRLGVDISEVTIVNSEAREWPDSGLGCPDPNMNYLTVITPGFLINLETGGDTYSYHTDRSGNFVLCGQDGQPMTE